MTAFLAADALLHAYALLLTQIVCKRCVGKVTATSQTAKQEPVPFDRSPLEFTELNCSREREPAQGRYLENENGTERNSE